MLEKSPPTGVSCSAKSEDNLGVLEATLLGPDDSPYAGGTFNLDIRIPDRYPFEPPEVSFITKIYHPNIDESGRICLDILKPKPSGNWKPCLNLSSVLTCIRLLMSSPNPDDPLIADIAAEYKFSKPLFLEKAKDYTKKFGQGSGPKRKTSGDAKNDDEPPRKSQAK